MTAEELFARVYELFPAREPAKLLALIDDEWDSVRARPASPHDAETCRLAMLAAFDSPDHGVAAADVWRARALARFALCGWSEGVASLLMGDAFRALSRANDDYQHGMTLDKIRASEEALLMLDELEPFAALPGSGISVSSRSPSPRLIARFLHEKRGFMLLIAGRYDEARRSYAVAAEAATGSERGKVKVHAGAALVEYVTAQAAGGDGTAAAEATEVVLADARRIEALDLVRIAQHNLAVMHRGDSSLHAYEIL